MSAIDFIEWLYTEHFIALLALTYCAAFVLFVIWKDL